MKWKKYLKPHRPNLNLPAHASTQDSFFTRLHRLAGHFQPSRRRPPEITAKSAILLDANTGAVLYKKNDTAQRPVASTQKLLTALIVAEAGNLSESVKVAEVDTNCDPTKLYLKPGQSYTRLQLLSALLVKSANDVARVLARDNAGNVSSFAERMTRRMTELGGTSSNFINPNGLPASGQYSTARDMARVARAAYRNPTLREIMKTRYYDFRYSTGRSSRFAIPTGFSGPTRSAME